jgi:putative phosphonate metabolism protein
MRAAVYYAPVPNDPLWVAACSWLGRDPETAALRTQPPLEDLARLTASPRLYGFHATLKPPMRLSTAYDAFMDDVRALASSQTPFELPPLAVTNHHGFLALRETVASPPLHALADACVERLDAHRAPASEAELAKRRRNGLPADQEAMLQRWGYPYVMGTWFFHMTLSERLSEADHARLRPAAEAHFQQALQRPRRVEALSIFTQAAPGAPFLVAERVPLGG